MIPSRPPRPGARLAVLLGLASAAWWPSLPALAQTPAKPQKPGALPKLSSLENCHWTFGSSGPAGKGEGAGEQSGKVQEFSGYVDLDCGEFRIQADRLLYDRENKTVEADGNASLTWQGNRLAGRVLHFNIEDETGSIDQAVGTFPPDAVVVADEMEKISDDVVRIRNGVFSSCTQPVPYWSFHVRRGRFHLNHYAYLTGVSMRVRRLPIFYTPYLVWPIKGDRATGLLFPQWGTSRTLGFFAGEQFFWALAKNADLTLEGDYYQTAGPAGGVELNWLPDARGRVEFDAYGLNDRRTDEARYRLALRAEQRFGSGWRAVADLNEVSDFRYYFDFSRTLFTASAPATISTVNLTRNWSYYSFAMRAQDREQFFLSDTFFGKLLREDLRQQMRPELELRARSRRIADLPLYLSFQARADLIGRSVQSFDRDLDLNGSPGGRFNADYGRMDFNGRLSYPLSPVPWLDVETGLLFRDTYWTASQTAELVREGTLRSGGEVLQEKGLNRMFAEATVELIGPKFFEVWEPGQGSSGRRFKHVIEPRLLWEFAPEMDYRRQAVDPETGRTEADPATGRQLLAGAIPFDEIEFSSNAFQTLHQVTYGVRQRVLARRPAAPIAPAAGGSRAPGVFGPPWGPGSLAPQPPSAPLAPAPPGVHYPAAAGESTPVESSTGEATEAATTGPSGEAAATEAEAGSATTGPSGEAAAAEAEAGSAAVEAGAAAQVPAPASWPVTAQAAPLPPAPGLEAAAAARSTVQENPVEIASLEILQTYSFEMPLSRFTPFRKEKVIDPATGLPVLDPVTGEPIFQSVPQRERTRHYGPVSLVARVNPSVNLSFDLRTDYDPLQKVFRSETLSTSARSGRLGYVNLSWVRARRAANTINVSGGTALFDRKLLVDLRANWDQKASRLLDRAMTLGYYTQCCGFIAQYDRREFLGNPRQEFRFIVDLKGIGKFLDLNAGTTP